MSKAYKKINFRDFSGGQGMEFTYSVDPDKFLKSDKIQVSILSKKLSAAKKYSEKTALTTSDGEEYGYHTMLNFDGKAFLFYTDENDKPQVSSVYENNAITEIYTFPHTGEILGFFSSGIYLIVSFLDDVDGEVSYYSANKGVSWTLMPHFVFELVTLNKYTYIRFYDYGTSVETLEKTLDFVTYTIVYTGNCNNLYVVGGYLYSSNRRFERDTEFVDVKTIPAYISLVANNYAYAIRIKSIDFNTLPDDIISIYKSDGHTFEKFAEIPMKDDLQVYTRLSTYAKESYSIISGKKIGEFYVIINYEDSGGNDYVIIYQLLDDGTYYKIYTSAQGMRFQAAVVTGDTLYLQLYKVADVAYKITNDYVLQFQTAAQVDTPVVDIGEFTIKRVTVKHRPLQAGTSVKIYVKYNYATSWTEIINSNTTNSIRKDFNVTAGSKYDNAQFRIELNTTDDTKTAEDVQLEVLYKPIGLENA